MEVIRPIIALIVLGIVLLPPLALGLVILLLHALETLLLAIVCTLMGSALELARIVAGLSKENDLMSGQDQEMKGSQSSETPNEPPQA